MPQQDTQTYEVEVGGKVYEVDVPRGTPVAKAHRMAMSYVKGQTAPKPVAPARPAVSDLDSLSIPTPDFGGVAAGSLLPDRIAPHPAATTGRRELKDAPTYKEDKVGIPSSRPMKGTSLVRKPVTGYNPNKGGEERRAQKIKERGISPEVQEARIKRELLNKQYGEDKVNKALKQYGQNRLSPTADLIAAGAIPGISPQDAQDIASITEAEAPLTGIPRRIQNIQEQASSQGAEGVAGQIAGTAVGGLFPALAPGPLKLAPLLLRFGAQGVAALLAAAGAGALEEGLYNPTPFDTQERLAQGRRDYPVESILAQQATSPMSGKFSLYPSMSMLPAAGIGAATEYGQQVASNVMAPAGQGPGYDPLAIALGGLVNAVTNDPYAITNNRGLGMTPPATRPRPTSLGIPEAKPGAKFTPGDPIVPSRPPVPYGPPEPPPVYGPMPAPVADAPVKPAVKRPAKAPAKPVETPAPASAAETPPAPVVASQETVIPTTPEPAQVRKPLNGIKPGDNATLKGDNGENTPIRLDGVDENGDIHITYRAGEFKGQQALLVKGLENFIERDSPTPAPAKKTAGRKMSPKPLTPEQNEALGRLTASEEKTAIDNAVITAHSGKPYTFSVDGLDASSRAFLEQAQKNGQVTVETDGKRVTVTPGRNYESLLNDYIIHVSPEVKRGRGRPSTKGTGMESVPVASSVTGKVEPTPTGKVTPTKTPATAESPAVVKVRERLDAEGSVRFPSDPSEKSPIRSYLDAEVAAGRLEREVKGDNSVIYRKKKEPVAVPPKSERSPLLDEGIPYPDPALPKNSGRRSAQASARDAEMARLHPLLSRGNPDNQRTAEALSAMAQVLKKRKVTLDENGYTLYHSGKKVGESVDNIYDAARIFSEELGLPVHESLKKTPPAKTGKQMKPREVAITIEGDHPQIGNIRKGLEKWLTDRTNPERQAETAVSLRTFAAIKAKGWDVRVDKDGFTLYDPKGKKVGASHKKVVDAAIEFGQAVGLTESDYTGRQNMRLPNKQGFRATDFQNGDYVLVKTPRGIRLDRVDSTYIHRSMNPGAFSGGVYLDGDSGVVMYTDGKKQKAAPFTKAGSLPEKKSIKDIVAILDKSEALDEDFVESLATDTSSPFGGRDREKLSIDYGQKLIDEQKAKAGIDSVDFDKVERIEMGYDKTYKLPGNPHEFLDRLDDTLVAHEKEIKRLEGELEKNRKRTGRINGTIDNELQAVIKNYNRYAAAKQAFRDIYPDAEQILKERRLGYRGDISLSYDPDATAITFNGKIIDGNNRPVGSSKSSVGAISLRVEGSILPDTYKAMRDGVTPGVSIRIKASPTGKTIHFMGPASALRSEWDRIHDFFELPRRPYPRQIEGQQMRLPKTEETATVADSKFLGRGRQSLLDAVDILAKDKSLSPEDAKNVRAFIEQLPEEYFENVAVRVDAKARVKNVPGYYMNSESLLAFARDLIRSSQTGGAVFPHEVAHHLERFLFREDAQTLYKQFQRERNAWLLAGKPERFENTFSDFSEWFAEAIRTNWLRQRGLPDPLDLYFMPRGTRFSDRIKRILHQSHNLAFALAKQLANLGRKDAAQMVWEKFVGAKYDATADYGQLQWRELNAYKGILPMRLPKEPAKPGITFAGEEVPKKREFDFRDWFGSPQSVFLPNHDPAAVDANRFGDTVTAGTWERFSPERGQKASREVVNAQYELNKNFNEWERRIDDITTLLREARGANSLLGKLKEKGSEIDKRRGLIAQTAEEAQWEEFVDLIEKDFTDPTRKSSNPTLQKALELHDQLTKDWLDYIRTSQSSMGKELPPDWGVTDKGYFRHLFLGNIKMRVYDPASKEWRFHKDFKSYNDALIEAKSLLDKDPSLSIDLGGSLNATGDTVSRVSTAKFWQTVNEMTKSASQAASTAGGATIKLTKEDMLADLNGLSTNSSKRKGLTLLLKRTGVDGYSKAYGDVMTATAYQMARAQELSKLNKKLVPLIEAEAREGDASLAREMQYYLDNLWGIPAEWETSVGRVLIAAGNPFFKSLDGAEPVSVVRNMARKIVEVQSALKLSLNLKSAAVNLYQPMTTLWPYAKTGDVVGAYKLAFSKDFQKKMIENGVLSSSSKIETGDIVNTSSSKWYEVFKKASDTNRAVGYAYGWQQAKARGLVDWQADIMGKTWAQLVEFDNSAWNSARILRSPGQRVSFQFKGFEFKNAERVFGKGGALNFRDNRTHVQKMKAATKFLSALAFGAGLNSLGPLSIVAGSLVYYAAYTAGEEAGMTEEEAQTYASLIQTGVPSAFKYGVDVSSSLQILQEPYGNDWNEKLVNYLGGPTISSLVRGGQAAGEFAFGGKVPTVATVGGLSPYARQIDAIIQAIAAKGEMDEADAKNNTRTNFFDPDEIVNRVKIGNEQEITLNAIESGQRALGFTPAKVSRAYAMRDAQARLQKSAKREENFRALEEKAGEAAQSAREMIEGGKK